MRTRATRRAMPRPRPRGRDPISEIIRALRRLRLPKLNSIVSLVGISGIFFGTLAISLVIAISIRATGDSDALNPFGEDVAYAAIPTATPHATPNPSFEATPLVGWQGTDRVTVLVMGVDARPGEEVGRPCRATCTWMCQAMDWSGSTLPIRWAALHWLSTRSNTIWVCGSIIT